MESLIFFWRSRYPEIKDSRDKFSTMWKHAFEIKGHAASSFDDYGEFYENVRIAIVHPTNEHRIDIVNKLNFLVVYQGIRHGWEAVASLADALGESHEKHSWKTMCGIHGLPDIVNEDDYPNLTELLRALYQRHLQYLNCHKENM